MREGRITSLKENEVFVFGSNLAGRHGRGAALQALRFGAKRGIGTGHVGQTYGIATKDHHLNTLSLRSIQRQIEEFYVYTMSRPDLIFLVTPIGCGLAGYKPEHIAPLFRTWECPSNVKLPKIFE